MKFALAAVALVLSLTTAACADTAWVLALPPLASTTVVNEAGKSEPAGADRTKRLVMGAINRTAPVDEWKPGQRFERGEACEDARLEHLRQFDEAVDTVGSATVSPATMKRLTELAREAFGRCVPAFAFAPQSPSASTAASATSPTR